MTPRPVGNCAKADAFFAEAFANSGGNDPKKSAEGPPYLFPRLWQFPQATLPRGSILQPGAGAWQFLQLLRARMPEERRSGSGPAWSTP